MQAAPRLMLTSICFVLLISYDPILSAGYLQGFSASQLKISANPSSVEIKVGEKASVNLTVTGKSASGKVCFSEQGFPSSGFTITFLPQCALVQQGFASAQLIVEATPAAAPQNFTAQILATLGNETVSVSLTITVVPAIPALIPWLGILLFFLVLGAALFVRPGNSRKRKGKGKMEG